MKALNVHVGKRCWLDITLRDMAQSRLNKLEVPDALRVLKVLLEEAFGMYARWIAYDGEEPVITVELARDSTMSDESIIDRASEQLAKHEARIYETLITWNDFHP